MDRLMEEFIKAERWEREVEIAYYKGINKTLLRKLTEPDFRTKICLAVLNGRYVIAPPRMSLIPKDNGAFRTVYINEDLDRIILSLINNILFDLCPHWISKHCTSYQKGIGCGKVVRRVADWQRETRAFGKKKVIGCKTDLSKYFDSVPLRIIDQVFAKLRKEFGDSPVIDLLQNYYHQDLCFDLEGNLIEHYQSLKQGCATASFFADVILYDVDEQMAALGNYVRYSDDMLFIHPKWKRAQIFLKKELFKIGLGLNPNKVEKVKKNRWIKFLGFSIKEDKISLSKSRVKTFQNEVQKHTKGDFKASLNNINRYLYKGYGREGYCWATSVLPIINCDNDINELNKYVIDALRASQTGRRKIGGLGYEHHRDGVITRGVGRHVKANREKTGQIEGYLSVQCMRNALLTNRAAYDALVRTM